MHSFLICFTANCAKDRAGVAGREGEGKRVKDTDTGTDKDISSEIVLRVLKCQAKRKNGLK